MNQVRWVRKEGSIDLEVNEGKGWINYKASEKYTSSDGIRQETFATFQKCLKSNYLVAETLDSAKITEVPQTFCSL